MSIPGFPEVEDAHVDIETGEITDPDEKTMLDYPYETVGQFVHDYFIPTYPKPLKHGKHWCPRWFEHPEAVEVFRALWRAHEDLGPADVAGWLRDLLYPLTDRLLSNEGPFTECEDGRHKPEQDVAPLPTVELPPGF